MFNFEFHVVESRFLYASTNSSDLIQINCTYIFQKRRSENTEFLQIIPQTTKKMHLDLQIIPVIVTSKLPVKNEDVQSRSAAIFYYFSLLL